MRVLGATLYVFSCVNFRGIKDGEAEENIDNKNNYKRGYPYDDCKTVMTIC